MSNARSKQTCGSGWYEVTREYLGTDYDPAGIDAEKYRQVMPRPEGYYTLYDVAAGSPPEGHVDDTPHGRSMIDREQVLKPVEVDEDMAILDGFDRYDVALRHGIACPLVLVRGLRADQKEDYITEVNTARRNLDDRVRLALAERYIKREEEDYNTGKATYRSTYNKVAVLHGVSLRKVRQLERMMYPVRWMAACEGETRISQNGKTFEVRETEPESQLQGFRDKLKDETPLDQQEAAVKGIKDLLEKHGGVLGGKERKEVKAEVAEADRRVRERRAAESRAQTARARSESGTGSKAESDATKNPVGDEARNDGDMTVADLLQAVESEPALAEPDRRPFTAAVASYLDQRLLVRDELTTDEDWGDRVARVAERGGVTAEDLLRLMLRRPSSLDPALQVLDRLFLAGGGDPAALRDSITKNLLMVILGQAA